MVTTSVPPDGEVRAFDWGDEAVRASHSSRLRGAPNPGKYSGRGLDRRQVLLVRTAPSAVEK